ncbi:nuclear transcription factor Y subunit A-3-like isoform X2 [Silene latifolia]
MSHLYPNYSSWSSSDQRLSSESLSLKVDSPPQLRLNTMPPLGFHLQDMDSSSSQSTQSNHDLIGTPGPNSQDQCMSSETGHEVNGGSNYLGELKPIYMMGHPETARNTAHIDYNRTMAFMPYPCVGPHFNGLMPTYGPTPLIQNQIMGMNSARIPLPVDISEDEPIYVNAKQYHGILRRRQSRAKLEAQNKLIKARKPYLHESRHLHAVKRVRGTGGRFLSTKKQSASTSSHNHSNSSSNPFSHSNVNTLEFDSHHQSQYMESGTLSGSAFYQQTESGFLGISAGGAMQQNGGFMNSSNQHCASVVR